jgi:ATP-binding cassette subfamily B protein
MKRSKIDVKDLPEVEGPTLRRIATYLRPYRKLATLVTVTIVGAALLNALPPLFVRHVVDHAIPERNLRLLYILCAGMVAGPLCAGLLGVAQKYYASMVGERVMFDLRVELFQHLQKQSLGWFASARPGEALSRVLNDVQGVGSVVSSTLVSIVQNVVVLTTTIVLIVYLDWRLALVALGVLPAFILPTRRVGRRRKAIKRDMQARMAEMTGILMETLSVSGALLLKVFGTEKVEAERLRGKASEVMNLSLQQTLVGRWFNMLMGLFETLGPAMVFGVGGWLVIHGQLKLGTIVAFVTLLKRLYSPASDLANVHIDVVTSYAYFERIFAVLDMEPAIRDAPDAVVLSAPRGEVRFEHVTFSYGAAGDEPVLEDIHLHVPAGTCVALVGPSGAGKSTLAALVSRLYDPSAGAVSVDGHDLRQLEVRSLRACIGVVTQDTYLFNATILENLRYARPEASAAEVEAAARQAQIHEFIAGLPEGYDTKVGDRGYRLSGGERQRLAIARAILKDPRILILDEATSALDSTNEALIQAAFDSLLKDRTSLVIAHRLSTIRKADMIVAMERGRIVERGTHEALLAANGLYARLYREQFRNDPDAAAAGAELATPASARTQLGH